MAANSLADSLARLQVGDNNNNLDYVSYQNGLVNGITIQAKPGARAYRNHVTITLVLNNDRVKCLTERKNKRDKDLPISAHEQRVNYMILSDAYDALDHFGVRGMSPVYDNRSTMYTPVPIKATAVTIPVDRLVHARGYVNGLEVTITIRNAEEYLDLNHPRFFTASDFVGREDHELRTFYELLTAQGSIDTKDCVSVGRELYIDLASDQQRHYQFGTSFLQGFKKNARIVSDNGKAVVKLIVDPVDSLFFAQQTLADSFHEISRGRYSDPDAARRFVDLFKNVRVYLTFYHSKILPVHGLSHQKLEDIEFDLHGTTTRVVDHFYNFYEFESQAGKMPALEVRLKSGEHVYYPLDCLEVLKCQKVPLSRFHLISATVNDDILKRNAVDALKRFNRTTTCFSFVAKSQHICESFGVSFNWDQQIQLGIRGKPKIALAGNVTVDPNAKTCFNLRGKRYIDPSSCKKWMILVPPGGRKDIEQPLRKLMDEARARGLGLAAPDFSNFNANDLHHENWDQLFKALVDYSYDYVLLIDPKANRRSQAHQMLKIYELRYGVQTQHVHTETLKKVFSHENILNKVNMKLHGLNYHVVLEPCSISKLYYDDKIFIIGYDVAHSPATGLTAEPEPSVVGVSFNACKQYQSFNGNYFYQTSKQESVNGELLKKTIMDGLNLRHLQRPNAGIPEMIFIFRDGLSEGQISMAKLEELRAIKEAVKEVYGRLPPFEMVLATKRHNRRFYTSQMQNVLPGTVASNGICRLGADEFYMQSAHPLQGTAKLTDYEVIANEGKLSLNDIQAFTHGMCYHHQIVGSAVSLPAPVFQSHELAKRGRNNYLCFRDTSNVPRIDDGGIEFLNANLTYTNSDLLCHRFTA